MAPLRYSTGFPSSDLEAVEGELGHVGRDEPARLGYAEIVRAVLAKGQVLRRTTKARRNSSATCSRQARQGMLDRAENNLILARCVLIASRTVFRRLKEKQAIGNEPDGLLMLLVAGTGFEPVTLSL